MVGQTSKSDHLGSTSFCLKCSSCQKIEDFCHQFCKFQPQLLGSLASSKLSRLAPNGQISTIDPPFDAVGSGFSIAPRTKAVRHDWEPTKPFFLKWEQNVTTKRLSTACTGVVFFERKFRTGFFSAHPNPLKDLKQAAVLRQDWGIVSFSNLTFLIFCFRQNVHKCHTDK